MTPPFLQLKIILESHMEILQPQKSVCNSGDFYFSPVNGPASAFLNADLFRPITETGPVQRALLHDFS